MDWTVEEDGELGFVTVVTRGLFTVPDHLRMIQDVVSRPFWRPGTCVLFDHRGLEFRVRGFRLHAGRGREPRGAR